MLPSRTRFFIAVAAACLWSAAGLSVRAETLKFPGDKPAFSVTLPEGWACTIDKDGDGTCQNSGDASYQIQIMSAPGEIKDDASVKPVLQHVLELVNEATKMANAQIGKAYELKNANKVKFIGQKSEGKVSGANVYVNALVFSPREGKYFMIEFIGAVAAKATNDKVTGSVLESIRAIKEGSGEAPGN